MLKPLQGQGLTLDSTLASQSFVSCAKWSILQFNQLFWVRIATVVRLILRGCIWSILCFTGVTQGFISFLGTMSQLNNWKGWGIEIGGVLMAWEQSKSKQRRKKWWMVAMEEMTDCVKSSIGNRCITSSTQIYCVKFLSNTFICQTHILCTQIIYTVNW